MLDRCQFLIGMIRPDENGTYNIPYFVSISYRYDTTLKCLCWVMCLLRCQFLIGMIRLSDKDTFGEYAPYVSIPYRYDTTTVFKPFLHRLSIQIVKNDIKLLPKVCQPLSPLYPKSKQNQAFSVIKSLTNHYISLH